MYINECMNIKNGVINTIMPYKACIDNAALYSNYFTLPQSIVIY